MSAGNYGRLQITEECLLMVLKLPLNTRIESLKKSDEFPRTWEMLVDSPGLKPIVEGASIPLVSASYVATGAGSEFAGWIQ